MIARSNALEGNVRLYTVVGGKREQFASWSGPVRTGTWHTLTLSVSGNEYVVTYDGEAVLRARSDLISGPGAAGLWTKADSVTAFDAITIESTR